MTSEWLPLSATLLAAVSGVVNLPLTVRSPPLVAPSVEPLLSLAAGAASVYLFVSLSLQMYHAKKPSHLNRALLISAFALLFLLAGTAHLGRPPPR